MDLHGLSGYVSGLRDDRGVRELGGLPGADGRRVRHGLLYRGSALDDLSDAERETVDSLGLRFVLDLRAAGEAQGREDYVPSGAEHVRVAGMYDRHGIEVDFSPAGIARLAERIAKNPERFMPDLYVSMLHGNPAVHLLIERLARGTAPLYFHCTAGKDRTGVCAAVVGMALGVADDDIMREFLLTNEYRANIIDNPPPGLSDEERAMWRSNNSVRASDLQEVFDALDERHPSREDYLREEFGLDAAAIDALRSRYLE